MSDLAFIIPTFNRPVLLQKCLDSILAQDLERVGSIYIAMDGETGITLQSQPDGVKSRIVQIRTGGVGPCKARNAVLARVSEEIVAFIDDDAQLQSGWVTECLKQFDAHPEVTAQLGRILWSEKRRPGFIRAVGSCVASQRQRVYDARDTLFQSGEFIDGLAETFSMPVSHGSSVSSSLSSSAATSVTLSGLSTHLSGGNSAVRRSFFDKRGFLNERYYTYHDRELAWRILSNNGIIAYNPEMTITHAHDPSMRRSLRRCAAAVPYEKMLKSEYPGIAEKLSSFQLTQTHSRLLSPLFSPEWFYESLLRIVHRQSTRNHERKQGNPETK